MRKQNLMIAARQTEQMVGRENNLEQIRQAVYAPDREFKILFIRAQGGMGKTRLLEELLYRSGHPDGDKLWGKRWQSPHKAAVSDLIDVINIRSHARNTFIKQIRDGLRHAQGVDFFTYDRAFAELRQLQASGAEFRRVRAAERHVAQAFIDDLKKVTKKQRVVLVLDTVEQLRFMTSEWLLKRQLLRPEDLEGRTYQWLDTFINQEGLDNITLILAGRGKEGKPFFEHIQRAIDTARESNQPRRLIDIEMKPFNMEETRKYFEYLADDWRNRPPQKAQTNPSVPNHLAHQFETAADENQERYKVIWLYTGGIPVRLALYAQLIVAKRTVSIPLQWPFKKACQEAGIENFDPKLDYNTPQLQRIRWDVEDEFVNLLFRNPNDLETRVLQALVRSPRGLNAEQLHYLLDSGKESPEDWKQSPFRLQELNELLHEMKAFYLVKGRAEWTEWEDLLPEEERSATTVRIGLQDEIYRIYAEHMAPHIELIKEDKKDKKELSPREIWETLPETKQKQYEQKQKYERDARQIQYKKLRAWANYQYRIYLAQKQTYLEADERDLELRLRLDDPRTFRFQNLGTVDVDHRLATQMAIQTYEIEAMVYALVLEPERNFNRDYVDLGVATHKAGYEEYDFWTQSEMWRILHDDSYSLKFADFEMREAIRIRKETPLQVLRRAAEQEDITRWIIRFIFRDDNKRGLGFAKETNRLIKQMADEDPNAWHSWGHTLVSVEREIWSIYAQIRLVSNVQRALDLLQAKITELHKLHNTPVGEVAITRQDGYEEEGFAPSKENIHPAYDRLHRLLSQAYNILGYGYITLGQIQASVDAYGQSLHYTRGEKGLDTHRAVVLNNLSKALSDLGWQSISVCRDGLNLRREQAQEVPLAYSYNTLALIYDNMGRFEDAQMLVAKALAYFYRADDARGKGLALLQLGEILRHLAGRSQTGESAVTTPDRLFTVVEGLLKEAQGIFEDTGEKGRLISVLIELGSLYRDRLQTIRGDESMHRHNYFRESMAYLNQALNFAQEEETNLQQSALAAQLNIARTYIYVRKYDTASDILNDIETSVSPAYIIKPTSKPDMKDASLPDIHWVLPLFSKLQTLRGHVALSRFVEIVDQYKERYPKDEDKDKRIQAVHKDEKAQPHLLEAAKCYSLALGYAELYAPGNRLAQRASEDLYAHLKGFNVQELTDFHDRAFEVERKYETLQGAAILGPFLHQFFGIPDEGHQHRRGSMHEVRHETN